MHTRFISRKFETLCFAAVLVSLIFFTLSFTTSAEPSRRETSEAIIALRVMKRNDYILYAQ